MQFNSVDFMIFFPAVVAVYFVIPRKLREYWLLIASYYFYMGWNAKYALLIGSSTAITYVSGLLLDRADHTKEERAGKLQKKLVLAACMAVNLGILAVFKYGNFAINSVNYILSKIHVSAVERRFDLLLPVGISFYTFQALGYIMDVYRNDVEVEKNPVRYALFVSFFPQLVAGPIERSKNLLNQMRSIDQIQVWDAKRVASGGIFMIWGLFMKMVIADRIGILVMAILKDEAAGGFLLFWAMVLYSFQIYADFSGGIDVIMGLSEMLDIRLAENFRSPLVSRSVTEYWQRWHMSLGEFMEKYLYYPIVLNRSVMKFSKKIPNKYLKKVFSATLASVIVFILVGVWHGTGWNYVVYGCYQAFFVSTAVLLGPWYKKVRTALHINENALSWKLFQALRTFLILTFGRFFIRAKDLPQAFSLMARTFRNFSLRQTAILFDGTLCGYGLDYKNIRLMYLGIALLIAVDILHERKVKLRETVLRQDIVTRFAIYLLAVFAIIIFGIYGPEFSASSFIYQEF